jgi:flavin-dependent thymidylate synthase
MLINPVNDPLQDGISEVSLVQYVGNDHMIAMAARVSHANDLGDVDEVKDLKLIKFLLKNKHGCYDDQTEVLTSLGWVKWPLVESSHYLAAVDLNTHEVVFEKPSRVVCYPYDGDLLHTHGGQLDMMVTPNHHMVTSRRSSKSQVFTPCVLENAQEAFGKPRIYLSSGNLTARQEVVNPWGLSPSPFAELVGFFVGDGYCKDTAANYISFHFRRERKVNYLKDLCARLGLDLKELANDKYTVPLPLARDWFSKCYSQGEKVLPTEYLSCSVAETDSLLKGLKESDGNSKRNTWVYNTTSEKLADQIQHLAALNYFVVGVSREVKSDPHKDGLKLNISKRVRPRVEANQKNRSRSMREERVPYVGNVYCATVSTGALIVRRNMRVVVSGNSPLEHSLITFRLKMPLYVIQELLRHRAGTSVNQQSARYLNLGEKVPLEFYVPQKFRGQSQSNRQASSGDFECAPNAESTRAYLASLEQAKEAYNTLLGHGVARELARGVLPHCTYSSLYWTVNLRSLFHFIGLRDSPDAQWEIMRYAQAMKDIAKPLFPLCFQALQLPHLEEGGDCSNQFERRKN